MTKTAKRFTAFLLTLAVLLAFLPVLATPALADDETLKTITVDGFILDVYLDKDNKPTSVWIAGYSGTDTDLILPTHLIYNGVKRPIEEIKANAFKGNTNLTSVIVPNGYAIIGEGAFSGCTNLKEVTLGDSHPDYYELGNNAFTDCRNLKTIYVGKQTAEYCLIDTNSIGKKSDGSFVSGITVCIVAGSEFDKVIKTENESRKKSGKPEITPQYQTNPAAKANVTKVIPGSGGGQTGEDGTPYGKGASADAVNQAITKWTKEEDPAGTVYSGLQAKLTKVTKSSLKLTWKKVGGAKKYVIYGNQCGKKNKYAKLTTTTKTSMTFKKILGKKVKKGTYYKFMVVALDGKNKVVSSSKTVHAATLGGKVGNDKMVKTAAKKNKVALKKGKSFKLKAKAVPQSKKQKVQRHRPLKYETTNKKVATVNAKGVIKGTGKGSCFVYAYAQNGVAAKIKVTVK